MAEPRIPCTKSLAPSFSVNTLTSGRSGLGTGRTVASIQDKLFLLGLLQAGVMKDASGIVLAGAPLPNGVPQ